jgi:hypothetical protein
MTITLELKSGLDAHLEDLARISGLPLEAYVAKLIEEVAMPKTCNQTAVELLEAWSVEDTTDDSEELASRHREWEMHKKAMNEGHSSDRVLFP